MKTRTFTAILAATAAMLLLAANQCARETNRESARDESAARSGSQEGIRSATETGAQGVRGVDDGSSPATRRSTSIDERLLEGNARFAFALFAKTCGAGKTGNLFISPLSVSVALAMTYNGADGNTAAEMADVLGFKDMELLELNASMCELSTALELADSAVQLTVANSLWSRQGHEFIPAFIERTEMFYEAEVASLDFADPGAPAVINGWVERSTRGLIKRIVDAIHPDARLYLINAIYFKGRWQVEFDPSFTQNRAFYLAGGEEKSVPMMARSGSFRYAEDAGVQVVKLPYGSGRIGMYVFLPAETDSLSGFLEGLDERAFAGWLSKLASREGDVSIPRFKIEYECGLIPALSTLGMREAFGRSADFSRMSGEHLYISEVKHKAVVDVYEEGTEAAAVTSVEVRATSVEAPRDRFTFVADRPFFFVIRDDATGSILFMGAVYDPTA